MIAGRSWNATLTFFTDIGASFGTSGEHFSFTLHGSTAAATAPEPLASSLAGLGIVMLGLIRARRNPTPAVIAGRNQDPSS